VFCGIVLDTATSGLSKQLVVFLLAGCRCVAVLVGPGELMTRCANPHV